MRNSINASRGLRFTARDPLCLRGKVARIASAAVTIAPARFSNLHQNFLQIDVYVVSYATVGGPNQVARASGSPS
jgi:hypothetical protein